MNSNFKPRSKIDLQPTRTLKKVSPESTQTEESRRLYTEANDDRDYLGSTYKRINLYLNKNPLIENNKIHNSDKKSTPTATQPKGSPVVISIRRSLG